MGVMVILSSSRSEPESSFWANPRSGTTCSGIKWHMQMLWRNSPPSESQGKVHGCKRLRRRGWNFQRCRPVWQSPLVTWLLWATVGNGGWALSWLCGDISRKEQVPSKFATRYQEEVCIQQGWSSWVETMTSHEFSLAAVAPLQWSCRMSALACG